MMSLLREMLRRLKKRDEAAQGQVRLRGTAFPFLSLAVLLCVAAATGRSTAAWMQPFKNRSEEARLQTIVSAQVYDDFMQGFMPLRRDSGRRHTLAAQVLNAATEHQVDPDLLFALIAVESGFNSAATSSKGARGLGQVMLPTARAVAPNVIRRAQDLYDIRRNLYVTALEVRRLLDKWTGDVWAALSEYSTGTARRPAAQPGRSIYVARICMYFALLKTKRHYEELLAMKRGGAEPVNG